MLNRDSNHEICILAHIIAFIGRTQLNIYCDIVIPCLATQLSVWPLGNPPLSMATWQPNSQYGYLMAPHLSMATWWPTSQYGLLDGTTSPYGDLIAPASQYGYLMAPAYQYGHLMAPASQYRHLMAYLWVWPLGGPPLSMATWWHHLSVWPLGGPPLSTTIWWHTSFLFLLTHLSSMAT